MDVSGLHHGAKGVALMPIEENKHLKVRTPPPPPRAQSRGRVDSCLQPGWVVYVTGTSEVTRSLALLNATNKVCLVRHAHPSLHFCNS